MKFMTRSLFIMFLGSLLAGPVMAADGSAYVGNHVARRGDLMANHLDRRGIRINNRFDRRASHASANGHDRRAQRLERTGNRVERRMDHRGSHVDRRTEQFARRQ